jgi:hypothetical protein
VVCCCRWRSWTTRPTRCRRRQAAWRCGSRPACLRAAGANDRLRIAAIGTGGRGGANLAQIVKDAGVDVTVLCDVFEPNLLRAAERHPQALHPARRLDGHGLVAALAVAEERAGANDRRSHGDVDPLT